MRLHRLVTVLALVAGIVVATLPLAAPVLADCGLNNNSFEGSFTARTGDGQVNVPEGWEYWFQDGPDTQFSKNWRPFFGAFDAAYLGGKRVHGGNLSAKFGTSWATHNGGIFQRVAVTPQSQVTFSVWAQSWSSNGDDTNSVTSPGNYRLYVGIDPTGGTNWQAGTVRWSEPRIEYNTWVQLSISARAEGNAVTVFVRGNPEFPVKHSESCWDDACLQVTPPTAVPTVPPPPTAVPTATPPPTATPLPTATATAKPGSLCVQTFVDKNGNGTRDEGEDALEGVGLTLVDSQGKEVAKHTSSAAETSYCFKDLTAGNYVLNLQDPAGLQALKPKIGDLNLAAGSTLQVPAAFRVLPTATPRPTATATPPPTATPTPTPRPAGPLTIAGRGLWGVSGILLALVAIALPLSLRYWKRRS